MILGPDDRGPGWRLRSRARALPSVAASYRYASWLAHRGRYGEAEVEVRRALDAEPGSLGCLLLLSSVLQEQHRTTEAIDVAQRALAVTSGPMPSEHSLFVRTWLASLLRLSDRASDALACLEPVLGSRAANDVDVQRELGLSTNVMWFVTRDRRQAETMEAAYRRVLDVNRADDVIRRNLAAYLSEDGRHDEAESVLAGASTSIGSAGLLGLVRQRAGRTTDAEQGLREAARAAPEDTEVLCTLAGLVVTDGRLDEGEQIARRAVAIAPEAAKAHAILGAVLYVKREVDAAEHHIRRALALDPEDEISVGNLANLLLVDRKDPHQAITVIDRGLALSPHHANYLAIRARALLVLGDPAGPVALAAAHDALPAMRFSRPTAERIRRLILLMAVAHPIEPVVDAVGALVDSLRSDVRSLDRDDLSDVLATATSGVDPELFRALNAAVDGDLELEAVLALVHGDPT